MPIPRWRKSWEKWRPKQRACPCTGKKLLHQYLPGIEFIEAIKPLMEKDRFMAHLSKPSRLGAYVERVNQMLVG
jgi:hypothetical protein